MVWSILNKDQSNAIREIETSGSPRIIAIVGCAIADQSLRLALQYRMRLDKVWFRKAFKPTGSIGSFGALIDLGYLLYMFDEDTREALTGISEIRNLFSHNLRMSFDSKDDRMAKALLRFSLHDGKTHYTRIGHLIEKEEIRDALKIEPIENNQTKFIVNLKLALVHLIGDRSRHAPYSNAPMGASLRGPPTSP